MNCAGASSDETIQAEKHVDGHFSFNDFWIHTDGMLPVIKQLFIFNTPQNGILLWIKEKINSF